MDTVEIQPRNNENKILYCLLSLQNWNAKQKEIQAARGVVGFYTFILAIMTFFNLGSSYIFLMLNPVSTICLALLYWAASSTCKCSFISLIDRI